MSNRIRLKQDFTVPEHKIPMFGPIDSDDEFTITIPEVTYPKGLEVDMLRHGAAQKIFGIDDGTEVCVCIWNQSKPTKDTVGEVAIIVVPVNITEPVPCLHENTDSLIECHGDGNTWCKNCGRILH